MPAVCESAWPGCGLSGSVSGPNPFTSHIEGRGRLCALAGDGGLGWGSLSCSVAADSWF